jgi:predicted AlkP superfamily phosphohydrolase/phosphomutase
LGTSSPALSPVAWSTFTTGVDSSRHNIYDFLARDKRTYLPVLSSSEVYGGQKFIKLGPFRIPRGKGGVRMLRRSKSFWKILSDHGVFSSVLRVPITFPVEKMDGTMIAGMCVPDLRGTMGSFTYFTSSPEADKIGGMIVKVDKSHGWIDTAIPGPPSPVDDKVVELPLSFRVEADPRGMSVKIDDKTYFVPERTYSPWIHLSFKAAVGITLNGDPEKPAMPLSHPSFFSIYLSKLLGTFGTLGLAEDTWALNERVLDEQAFLDQVYLLHEERKAMWFHSLGKLRGGLVSCVFDISDRLQHMFFRYLDEDHPANKGKDTVKHKDALYQMYRDMDELLGETLEYVDDKTALFVVSDHGFKSFRRGVNLNTWFREQGLLVLKNDAGPGEYFSSVDWSKTKAYSVGLGGIYFNIRGRERQGIVDKKDVTRLKVEIAQGLSKLSDNGTRAVNRLIDVQEEFSGPYRDDGPELIPAFALGYRASWDGAKGTIGEDVFEDNTKSWSGDHCMDPALVPGILYSNLKLSADDPGLMDIGPTVLDLFGVDVPGHMTGKSIL